MNAIQEQKTMPIQLAVGRTIPFNKLCKKGGIPGTGDIRFITTLGIMVKLFELIVLNDLNNITNDKTKLVPEQMGFRKHQSTYMNMLRTRGMIQDMREAKTKNVYELYIDLVQAFDKAPHNIICSILKRKGLSETQLNRIKINMNAARTSLDGT